MAPTTVLAGFGPGRRRKVSCGEIAWRPRRRWTVARVRPIMGSWILDEPGGAGKLMRFWRSAAMVALLALAGGAEAAPKAGQPAPETTVLSSAATS